MGPSFANDDLRVHDYLEDKLQTAADLDALDMLLDNVRTQHSLLEKQLEEARREYAEENERASILSASLRQETKDFQRQQADLDRTLMIITQSDSTDDAVRRFEPIMSSLHRLDVANSYIELVEAVQTLSDSCKAKIGSDIDTAIAKYEKLMLLAARLGPLQEQAEGAAPHLVDLISLLAEQCKKALVDHLAADLDKTLKQTGWPKKTADVSKPMKPVWEQQAGRILQLQKNKQAELVRSNMMRQSKLDPTPLILLEIMIRPLAQRFHYHFTGDRMTNKLDKPEYFLNHVLDLIDEYNDFLQENVQPLLVRHFTGTDVASMPAYVDVTCAWINALMPLLYRKLESILPEVVRQPGLFSNLIHEIMTFDTRLANDWSFTPVSPDMLFRGLSYHVLSTLGYFAAWFSVERDFALARYEAIIDDRSTGQIDFDSVEHTLTKPTKAAFRVNDLLETVTDLYRPLVSFHQKLKFLIDTQIAIFDRFHGRLSEGLEAFLTRTSAVARTMHGVGNADIDVTGTKGLDRLCRVYGSAEYLEKAMQDWSEDIFFLDLWEELQTRSRSKKAFKGDLRVEDVAAKTSSSINDQILEADEVQGALFDETAASYHRLKKRSEQVLIDTVTYDVRASLRPYSKVNHWASMSSSGTATALTAELDGTIRILNDYLSFLSRALGKTSLRQIVRAMSLDLQAYLWNNILSTYTFSTAGATQLTNDVQAIWQTIDRYAGIRQAETYMRKLAEGLLILSLPVKAENATAEQQYRRRSSGVSLGLWEVEKRLFAGNDDAREVLDDLNLEAVTVLDARDVVRRRIEIAS